MYTTLVASALALAISPALAIPPESFGFPSAPNDTQLTVVYNTNGNLTPIEEAMLLGPDVPATEPTLAVNTQQYQSLADYDGSYLILMVDPDASTPQNPSSRFILHWMAPGFTAGDMTAGPDIPGMVLTNSTPAVVPYARPMPPPTSDPHRYILYAFQQPEDFAVPEAFSGYSAENRTSFNVTEFIAAAGLDDPAAANFFFASNATDVPGDFTAMAGGTYPGGNGGAITAGPGPSVTSSGSAMASATESAMSTGTEMATATATDAMASASEAASSAAESGAAATSEPAAAGNAAVALGPEMWVSSLLIAAGAAAAFYVL